MKTIILTIMLTVLGMSLFRGISNDFEEYVSVREACVQKGGVFVSRDRLCVKPEFFIR